jgi:hypothetical protein
LIDSWHLTSLQTITNIAYLYFTGPRLRCAHRYLCLCFAQDLTLHVLRGQHRPEADSAIQPPPDGAASTPTSLIDTTHDGGQEEAIMIECVETKRIQPS